MAVERIIGVDFGTSTSVIRVKRYENGNPIGEKLETKEVVFGGNGAMVPTLIMKKDDDASVSYFGYEAQQKKKKFTNFHSFKMNLESTDSALQAQAKLLTEEFFCYMAKQYKTQSEGGHLGNPDDKERTIISYPVKWSEETKNFMLETAKKVGFPNVTGMDEAQAAIQAVIVMSTDHLQKHGLLKNGEGANILLIDMGAGTTDLVLARYVPGENAKTEVLNTWPKSGDIQFGGREIDNLLQNFFREMLDEDDAEVIFRRIGSDKFKSWKEKTVSPALQKRDSVSDFEVLDSCVEMMGVDLDEYCLDRTAFEKCLADYLKQFPELVDGCLQNVGMSGSDVDLVVVTGGHSQWYFVNDMLTGKMPQFGNLDLPKIRENPARIVPISRPQETVALGLAYSGIHFDVSGGKAPMPPDPIIDKVAEPTFAMEIAKSFAVSSGVISVEGIIALGEVKNGDEVYVWDRTGERVLSAKVKNIMPGGDLMDFFKDDAVAAKEAHTVMLLEGLGLENLSVKTILFKETNDFAHVPLTVLTKIIEEWKQNIPEPLPPDPPTGDFSMRIDPYQVFATGQGTVVWGVIEEGRIKAGDRIYICGRANGQLLSDTVKRIDRENTIVQTAQKGDKVGLLLSFLQKHEVTAGTHLSCKADANRGGQNPIGPSEPGSPTPSVSDGANTYTIPGGKTIAGAVQLIKAHFASKEMETQYFQKGGCHVIQARKQAGAIMKFVGGNKAVEVRLTPINENRVSLKIGGGKWIDKAGGAVLSTIVLGSLAPLGLVVYGANAVDQALMIGEVKAVVEKYFSN